ncbi:MAG: hypothetical protein SYR96_03765 [Actinomycetota bacterium]|nr:hypothetical protein [Actinomycetota bacterium]
MAFVGIDTEGARALGVTLQDAAERTEDTRRQAVTALALADMTSQAPSQLALVQESLSKVGTGVIEKADLADRFTVAPQQTAASMGTTATDLGGAITGLLGFSGPRSLRDVLTGLPPAGTNAALDAALGRLTPVLLGPLMAGGRPELPKPPPAELVADLQLLALQLGIEHVGPPGGAAPRPEVDGGFFARLVKKAAPSDTEVFYNDFWADGRTVAEVLADPVELLAWVSGTVELDRRLALSAGLPTLSDALDSFDFARGTSGEVDLTAIETYLPTLLAGRTGQAPDATQLAQTLAFATRVGWTDPGATAATEAQRFAAAVAYLRANRILQSALLPTGFAGDTEPLAFMNAPGIEAILTLGRGSGVLDGTYLAGVASLLDRVAPAIGLNLTGPRPELTESIQQQLFALVASQIPRTMVDSPAIQGQFIAALGHLRQAATGPELRQRILDVVAAFRTVAVVGAPALTERQLSAIVGDQVAGVLGRSRLRLRSEGAIRKNPEFLLVARQWGIPGSRKEEIGKYKFSFGFDELGVLTGIRRKKKSWLSRAWDSIKAVGKAILESWKDNPFKAIFQVGKIALGVASFFVPGLQALGAASLALNLAETAYHAIEGDWMAAIGAGLSAFTAGTNLLGTAVDSLQGDVLKTLFSDSSLELLRNAKRAFDIGTSVLRFTEADGLLGTLTAGLGAAGSILGNGGQIIGSLGLDRQLAEDLVRLGTTVFDVNKVAGPAVGVIEAIRKGDLLVAFGNGLAAVSAGALALTNGKGALSGSSLFNFDARDRASLTALAQGTGVAANLARAINAADAGNAFAAGAALAEALRITGVTRPQPGVTSDEALGDPALVARRLAEMSAVLEAVFKGADPAVAAPIVMRQLGLVVDALNPAPPKGIQPGRVSVPTPVPGAAPVPGISVGTDPGVSVPAPVPGFPPGPDAPAGAPVPVPSADVPGVSTDVPGISIGGDVLADGDGADSLAGGNGADSLAGGSGSDMLVETFSAGTLSADGGARIDFGHGRGEAEDDQGFYIVPPGGSVTLPDGTVYQGGDRAPGAPFVFPLPGGGSMPGKLFDEPTMPGLELFFPDNEEDIPQSSNDRFDGLRFAATGTSSLTDAGPVIRSAPLPFLYPPLPETQLTMPIDRFGDPADAYTLNPVLEGGSRTIDLTLGPLSAGTSVTGPDMLSHSFHIGTPGFEYAENQEPAVDGLTINAEIGTSLQYAQYGGQAKVGGNLNLGPIMDWELPDLTLESTLGVNIPYIGAIGFKAEGNNIRLLEQYDFPVAVAVDGDLGGRIGVKVPTWGEYRDKQIAGMVGVDADGVRLVQQAPSGTRLVFDVAEQFSEPFQPPFGATPDLGEPVDTPVLDGIVLDYGGPEGYGFTDINSTYYTVEDYGTASFELSGYDFGDVALSGYQLDDFGATGFSYSDYSLTDYGFANNDFSSYEF